MMFHGDTWLAFEQKHPEEAKRLKWYINNGGEWSTIFYLPEFQSFMRFENAEAGR